MPPPIKALFLDMDGVLWRDLQPIGDLPANLQLAADIGFQLVFITNNATRTPAHYIQVFAKFGIDVDAQQLYTSAITTAQQLHERWPAGGPVFILGEEGLANALQAHNFTHSAENALAVVAALDRQLTYEKLTRATLLIRAGLPFYGTNPDRTLPTPAGQAPGAGALIASLEAASGVQATIIGKPQPTMLLAALKDLGLPPEQALMVGDRLETDIAAGQNAGCQTALVLSGASTQSDLQQWPQKPDFIAPNLAKLLEMV